METENGEATQVRMNAAFPGLGSLPEGAERIEDPNGVGVFLRLRSGKPAARLTFPLGSLNDLRRFTACHRYEPFWMTPNAGTRGGEVRPETQFLLVERTDGSVVLFVPLISGAFRCSLEGAGENELRLIAESGDEAIVTDTVVGLFVAEGADPYELVSEASVSVAAFLKTGRLRWDKAYPGFIDYFGWCTWDAFYQDVSHDRVREGLDSFRQAGITPRYLILDDGWQSVRTFPTGEKRLISFAANEKFPGDLGPTVRMAKEEFGIETFLVWHAILGYWGGVDGEALPGYGVRSVTRRYSPGIDHYVPTLREWFGTACGTVHNALIYRFYQDYHRHLREQGVDGVKVDNQASLEGLTHGGGYGGRVAIMRTYHEALEGAVETQFLGNLINCMSCANETFYSLLNSTITRTSTDFWPNRPESHGLHLYCNAQVSFWFGEFCLPDWDMFQSGHPAGAFHAAGRALSGGPIYVSDKPGTHDVELLKKLVLPDGSVVRCDFPGRPTRDCLFSDPTREDVLLKIVNAVYSTVDRWNGFGEGAEMIGVFHARHGEGVGPISGVVRPTDLPGRRSDEPATRYAIYSHYEQALRTLRPSDEIAVTLQPLTAEIFTLVRTYGSENGEFAPIGIADLFNSYGAIASCERAVTETGTEWTLLLLSGGTFVAYVSRSPKAVAVEETPTEFSYEESTGKLSVSIPKSDVRLTIST
ncbi:MAG: Sip1-related alpha-galactosidase [Capsulimonadales bacterium]|nr:Sip1-related alpha-galactosidase [Capsulimonadales bacterium]